jgi:hypothetical protein
MQIFREFSPIVPVVALGIPYLATRLMFRLKTFGKVIDSLPNHWIIGVQIFRTLGIIFLFLYADGILPGEFAIPSGVGDIIIGLTAPIVAILYLRRTSFSKRLAIIWNYVGIADLVIAILMGSVTAPTIVQLLSFDLPNEPIISDPLVTVPTFAVPFSLILHLISLRIMRKNS